ncbi:hypothetical protein LUR56_04095 [Streptomyces sp. MT29]|nr:hypothetical protein [Streptomyces sp. MT29]
MIDTLGRVFGTPWNAVMAGLIATWAHFGPQGTRMRLGRPWRGRRRLTGHPLPPRVRQRRERQGEHSRRRAPQEQPLQAVLTPPQVLQTAFASPLDQSRGYPHRPAGALRRTGDRNLERQLAADEGVFSFHQGDRVSASLRPAPTPLGSERSAAAALSSLTARNSSNSASTSCPANPFVSRRQSEMARSAIEQDSTHSGQSSAVRAASRSSTADWTDKAYCHAAFAP